MLYSVQIIKGGRYIKYCDKCWYETTSEPLYIYTKEEAEAVANQMKNHYAYRLFIIAENGTTTVVDHLKKTTNPMLEVTPTTKKSLFKISTKKRYE